ncbi:MAG: tyrosine protein kinase, partial [Bacteroidia bacterium]|nr:tyrosine protein kinase [Bacteroidia bacterium]
MMKKLNNKDELREIIEKYLAHWKWYIACILVCIVLAFINLRYSTDAYKIQATIRINENMADENVVEGYSNTNQSYRNKDASKIVKDEIEVLKSRPLIKKIVQDLNLNIRIFGQGSFKATEYYNNEPIAINFLSNDSIINSIDTILTVHVRNNSKYLLEKGGKENTFGEKVNTPFGAIVITPNIEDENELINKDFTIKIRPIEKMINYYSSSIIIKSGGEDSSIINVSIIEPIRKKGIAIINRLIKVYNDQIIEQKNIVIEETSNFINKRLEVVSSELSQVDLTAEIIKKDNRLTDLGSQSSIYLQSERDIENQQATTSTQLRLIEYMRNYLDENNSNGDLLPADMSFEENSINETTRRHNELVLQRDRILKNSSEINPVVINLNEQINNLKQSLSTSLRNIESSNLIRLDALNKEDQRISSK